MKISNALFEHVRTFEGVHDGDSIRPGYQPMLCPAGKVTIGWGEVLIDPKTGKQAEGPEALERLKNVVRTEQEANNFLINRLARDRAKIRDRYPTLSESQLDALAGMAYNTGLGAVLGPNTGLAKALQNEDHVAAQKEMLRWNKSTVGGELVVMPGLVRRRAAEAAMFAGRAGQEMPRSVEPPAQPKTSPGEVGAVATFGSASLSLAISEASQLRDLLQSLGLSPQAVVAALAGLCIGLGLLWLYRARRNRLENGQ